jgi:hypothetical protein
MSGYFTMEVHVDQGVEVELDTDEVLGNMDSGDVLEYVNNHYSSDCILRALDRDEVNEFVLSRMDHDTLQSEVLKNCSISTLLRAIADKLDNQ